MNAEIIMTFLAAVETGSFTAAAGDLFVSQATVSTRIQSLETELGIQLFRRTARGIALTEAGAALVEPARRFLEAEAALRAAANDDADRHTIRLGTSPGSSSYVTPYIMHAIRRNIPQALLRVEVNEVPLLLDHIASGDLDLAILEPCGFQKGVRFEWLNDDRVVFVAATDSPFAQIPGPVAPHVLAKLPFVQRHRRCCTVEFICKQFQAVSNGSIKQPNVIAWVSELDMIKSLVRSGTIVTALSEWAVVEELACGDFVALDVPDMDLLRQRVLAVADVEQLPPAVEEAVHVVTSPECRDTISSLERFRWWLNVERVGGACSLDR